MMKVIPETHRAH